MKTRCTQAQEILAYLKRGRSITPLTALRHFGCFRLGARIFDLRQAGHDIKRTWLHLGDGRKVAKYSLKALPKNPYPVMNKALAR